MSIGVWQLILILVIVLVVFGAGKLPRVMGDMGKGARAFRDGLKDEKDDPAPVEEPVVSKAEQIRALVVEDTISAEDTFSSNYAILPEGAEIIPVAAAPKKTVAPASKPAPVAAKKPAVKKPAAKKPAAKAAPKKAAPKKTAAKPAAKKPVAKKPAAKKAAPKKTAAKPAAKKAAVKKTASASPKKKAVKKA